MASRNRKKRKTSRRRMSPKDNTVIKINGEEVEADEKTYIKPRMPMRKAKISIIGNTSEKIADKKSSKTPLGNSSDNVITNDNSNSDINPSEPISKNESNKNDLSLSNDDNDHNIKSNSDIDPSDPISKSEPAENIELQSEPPDPPVDEVELNLESDLLLSEKEKISKSKPKKPPSKTLEDDGGTEIDPSKEEDQNISKSELKEDGNAEIDPSKEDDQNISKNEPPEVPSDSFKEEDHNISKSELKDDHQARSEEKIDKEPIPNNEHVGLKIDIDKEMELEYKRIQIVKEKRIKELELIKKQEQAEIIILNKRKNKLLELQKEKESILKQEEEIKKLKEKKRIEKEEKELKKKRKIQDELKNALKIEKQEQIKRDEKIKKMKEQLRSLSGHKKKVKKPMYRPRYRQRPGRRVPKIRIKSRMRSKKENIPPRKKKMPDYDNMSIIEKARYRAEFKMKLNDLKSRWTKYEIPGYSNDDLKIQHIEYYAICDQLLRLVYNARTKGFILLVWAGIEIVGTKFIGIDISDFANSQYQNFELYDHIINEMNSQGGLGIGRSWPPVYQLIGLTILNIVLLIIMKWLSKRGGSSIVNIVNNLVQGVIGPQNTNVKSPGFENKVESGPNPPNGMIETVARNVNNVANFFSTNPQQKSNQSSETQRRRRPRFSD